MRSSVKASTLCANAFAKTWHSDERGGDRKREPWVVHPVRASRFIERTKRKQTAAFLAHAGENLADGSPVTRDCSRNGALVKKKLSITASCAFESPFQMRGTAKTVYYSAQSDAQLKLSLFINVSFYGERERFCVGKAHLSACV